MARSKNARIWEERGISREAHERCDAAMLLVAEAAQIAGPEVLRAVCEEALFQIHELPKRDAAFQAKHTWQP